MPNMMPRKPTSAARRMPDGPCCEPNMMMAGSQVATPIGRPCSSSALAKNRGFLDHDGEMSLDAGPLVAALEYASGREATVLGKPSRTFFTLAVEGLHCVRLRSCNGSR